MNKQSAVLLEFKLRKNAVNELEALLNKGGNPQLNEEFFSLKKIPSVHFARWVIVPASKNFEASLIYSANIDGTPEHHFKELNTLLHLDLDRIFQYCIGSEDQFDEHSRLAFMQKHSTRTTTFYVGAPERSVQRIKFEKEFHSAIKTYVSENQNEWKSSKEAFESIQQFVQSDEKLSSKNQSTLPKKNVFKMLLLVLLVVAMLPILLIWVLLIHLFYESRLKPFGKSIVDVSTEHYQNLKQQEDVIYQNQLSQVFETKGGLRKLFLKFILWVTNFAAKNWFVEGQLFGTPTIHFARWAFIDNGKRFVFFSNFDGSYDGYLGDFVDNNGWGLNAIYGAAVGYPKTFLVFGKGSYKLSEFLGWGRITQIPTQIWYSAYPESGLQQIIRKSLLHKEMTSEKALSEEQIRKTLKRI